MSHWPLEDRGRAAHLHGALWLRRPARVAERRAERTWEMSDY